MKLEYEVRNIARNRINDIEILKFMDWQHRSSKIYRCESMNTRFLRIDWVNWEQDRHVEIQGRMDDGWQPVLGGLALGETR